MRGRREFGIIRVVWENVPTNFKDKQGVKNMKKLMTIMAVAASALFAFGDVTLPTRLIGCSMAMLHKRICW